jgi:preprotein translocase subunit SecF
MALAIGNIYERKNYKFYVILPIALLLIALLFISHIPLDSTLKGGISVQLQTNSTINIQSLTSAIDSRIPGAQAEVSISPGGVSATIATNTSLAAAQQNLLNLYSLDSNYSTATAQIAVLQNQLKAQPTNATLQTHLTSMQANSTLYLSGMGTQLTQMLKSLGPLLNGKSFSVNSTNAAQMLQSGTNAYSNASASYKKYVMGALSAVIPFTSYTYQEVTPTLGSFFLQQMQWVIIASFILIAIAVFFVFRTPIPAMAVVFGAGNDILVALGAMGAFGIPLGVASIGGLLMLIGFSIDTDMLAAIRIIKRAEGTPTERAFSTMKTGLTMTFAAIITFSVLLVVSYITFIPTYFEISSVVLFGLMADVFTTWFGNTVMVLWWKQKKDARFS